MQKVKTKSIFSIAIILISILLAFMLYRDRAEFSKLFNDDAPPYKEDILPIKDHDNLAVENTKQTTKHSSAKHLINYVNSFIPPTPDIASANIDINNYRDYLLNVNLLIFYFLQNQNYDKQLQVIKTLSLPQDIQAILVNLNRYNNDYLLEKIKDSEKVFPTDQYSWLEKFIKIKRKSTAQQEKEKLHIEILQKLEFFINFFYSEKFIK